MATWGRDTPWRQGHILSDQAITALGLILEAQTKQVAIVVSHDCDLAQDPSIEPTVEVIVGHRITNENGNFTYAKNARRLHLTFSSGIEHLVVDIKAHSKFQVPKHQLSAYQPINSIRLTPNERNILQRWLAARYRRSAFPDEFDRRLESTGIRDRLIKILKSTSSMIAAIYFDVDRGEELSRAGSDEPYALVIYLLFSTENDFEDAEQVATTAKQNIITAFGERCISKETGTWHEIELVDCEVISDQAMTVQQAESLKRWSADHLSLRTESGQAMLRDE